MLRPPPELSQPDTGNVWLTALPALSGLGSVAYLFGGPPSPITYVAGSFFLFSSLAMVGGSLARSRSTRRGDTSTGRREYLRYLGQIREQVRRSAAAQRENAAWHAPAPDQLWVLAAGPRLWERRSADPDFGVVRFGTGPQYLATRLVPGESGPLEDLDPLCALALRRFVTAHAVVPCLPLELSLRRFAAVGFAGDRAPARACVRAILAHAATVHTPDDLRIVVCTSRQESDDWSWLKWLPHVHDPERSDGAGPARLIDPSLAVLEERLSAEVTSRPRYNRTAAPNPDQPHIVLVLDDGLVPSGSGTVDPDGLQGVTVFDLGGHTRELVAEHGLELRFDEGRVLLDDDPIGTPDTLAVPVADALARQLAGYRLDRSGSPGDPTATGRTLPALLDIPAPETLDLSLLWARQPIRDRLRVPIGVSADGTPLELDVKESAQDGMGPHGLLVGATGSGKSELLRTLVLAMAIRHSPEQLNLVLVDFKGGATFAHLGGLPHTSAVVTNLEDDLTLVDRMAEALAGELNRRQELLRRAGNLVSIRDYDLARQRDSGLPPMPSLFIVIDEFSELLSQKPDFADLFAQIGRLGRSLGLHLLLATQKLEEGRLRGLDAHLSYRICLRTFSEQESRAVIGMPDAAKLPAAPGHGYLKTEASTLKRFRAAYVSTSEGLTATAGTDPTAALLDVRSFPAGELPVRVASTQSAGLGPADPPRPTVLDVLVGQMVGRGKPAHRIWLPPLDQPEPLDALLPELTVREGRGFGTAPDSPPLTVPVGILDRPYLQRRDPLVVDLAGAGGHLAVVGGPSSGKSTLLRTLVTALALQHTPREVQFYVLDFSNTFFALARLPHIGGVAGRQDRDVVRRLVAQVSAVVEQRETRFRELGLGGMAEYRRLRASGGAADEDFGDVFLLVDGWPVLRQGFEDLEEFLIALAGRSLTYGVHLVLSANRWLDLRFGLRELVGTKLELKLGDALDSEVERRAAEAVPKDRPGRGISRDRLHFLAAVPRIDGRRDAADLGAGVTDLVSQVTAGWTGPTAPRLRTLPSMVEFDQLTPFAGGDRIVLGLEGQRLEPEPCLLHPVRDPRDHGLVLIGDLGSGKTSTLRQVARQVVDRGDPAAAKIVVVDYRLRMLREFDGLALLGFATGHQQAVDIVHGLVEGFTKRLPGPDVSAEQLRDRSWWSGPDVYIVVDDYDLVAGTSGNPLLPLLEFLPHAAAIGLHLYLARQAGGAAQALFDPLLSRMRQLGFPAIVLSTPADEGVIYGVRPARRPPGRGQLVRQSGTAVPVQLARLDSRHHRPAGDENSCK